MIVPDRIRTNGYRVLRLPVSASVSDIHKAAAGMRRAATLGLAGTTDADIPALGAVPRGDTDIRSAVGRLINPLQRLTDRLLWFYQPPQPPHLAAARTIPVLPDPSGHDRALHDLFQTLQADLDAAGIAAWVTVLRAWHAIVCDDDYWALALTHEDQGGFEPPAVFSEVDAVRADAVRLAAEPLILAGRAALAADERGTVRRVLVALAELGDTGPWAAAALEDIAYPEVGRFAALCKSAREKYSSRIVREQDAGARNKAACDEALEQFRGEIQPALDRVARLLPEDHELAQRIREEAARCLSGIATDYTWADDFISSETLNHEALSLARNTLGAIRIEESLSEVRGAAQEQRVFGALKPIASAPSLWTYNGFGFKMYGKSDADTDSNSYVTTYYFVALFIPVFPICRYRIIDESGGGYRFLGKLPLRKADRWHLSIAAAAVLAIFGMAINSDQTQGPSSTPSAGRRIQSGTSRSQLASLKARIDQGRAQSSALESRLQPVISELTGLNEQLQALGFELKTLDAQNKSGLTIDIDDYNAKVETHNQIIERRKALLSANRSDLDRYEALSTQDSALVEQYNALLRGNGQ